MIVARWEALQRGGSMALQMVEDGWVDAYRASRRVELNAVECESAAQGRVEVHVVEVANDMR